MAYYNLTSDEQQEYLQRRGLDPRFHKLLENDDGTLKVVSTHIDPSIANTVYEYGREGLGRATGGFVGGVLGGAGAGALAGLAGGPLAPITVPLAAIAGGIAGGWGGSELAHQVPKLWRSREDQAIQELRDEQLKAAHPAIAAASELAPQLLLLKPTPRMLKALGTGASKIANPLQYTTKLSELSQLERQALTQTGLGLGMQVPAAAQTYNDPNLSPGEKAALISAQLLIGGTATTPRALPKGFEKAITSRTEPIIARALRAKGQNIAPQSDLTPEQMSLRAQSEELANINQTESEAQAERAALQRAYNQYIEHGIGAEEAEALARQTVEAQQLQQRIAEMEANATGPGTRRQAEIDAQTAGEARAAEAQRVADAEAARLQDERDLAMLSEITGAKKPSGIAGEVELNMLPEAEGQMPLPFEEGLKPLPPQKELPLNDPRREIPLRDPNVEIPQMRAQAQDAARIQAENAAADAEIAARREADRQRAVQREQERPLQEKYDLTRENLRKSQLEERTRMAREEAEDRAALDAAQEDIVRKQQQLPPGAKTSRRLQSRKFGDLTQAEQLQVLAEADPDSLRLPPDQLTERLEQLRDVDIPAADQPAATPQELASEREFAKGLGLETMDVNYGPDVFGLFDPVSTRAGINPTIAPKGTLRHEAIHARIEALSRSRGGEKLAAKLRSIGEEKLTGAATDILLGVPEENAIARWGRDAIAGLRILRGVATEADYARGIAGLTRTGRQFPEAFAGTRPAEGAMPIYSKKNEALDIPSREPVQDLIAQRRDLDNPNSDRLGVYLPQPSVESLGSKGVRVLAGNRPVVENYDGRGGSMIFRDEASAQAGMNLIRAGMSEQEAIGRITGIGTGKPTDLASVVVQQRTPEGAVTMDTVAAPQDVAGTVDRLSEPGKTVQVRTPTDVVGERAARIQAEDPLMPKFSLRRGEMDSAIKDEPALSKTLPAFFAEQQRLRGIEFEGNKGQKAVDKKDLLSAMAKRNEAYKTNVRPIYTPEEAVAIAPFDTAMREYGVAARGVGAGPRGFDPDVVPHMPRQEVVDRMERDKTFKADVLAKYMAENQRIYAARGLTFDPVEAEAYFNDYFNGVSSGQGVGPFNALHKTARPYYFPDELRETDPFQLLSRYGIRASRDIAREGTVQADPASAAALGIDPATGNRTIMMRSPALKNIADAIYGSLSVPQGDRTGHELIRGAQSVAHAGLIQAPTGIRNILQALPNMGRNMVTFTGEYTPAAEGTFNTMLDYFNIRNRAIKSGALDPNVSTHRLTEDMDLVNKWAKGMNTGADVVRTASGAKKLEEISRVWNFAVGEKMAEFHLGNAATDARSQRWLDKFGANVKPTDSAADKITKIAANYVRNLQGSYSAEGLPAWMLRPGAGSILMRLNRYGIENVNNVVKSIVPEMRQGNFAPFLNWALGGVVSAAAVKQLNDLLRGAQSKSPSSKEVDELLPKDERIRRDYEAALNILEAIDASGMAGFAGNVTGDFARSNRGQAQSPVSFPMGAWMVGIGRNLSGAIDAIEQGADVGQVVPEALLRAATDALQNVRAVRNLAMSPEEKQEKQDKRNRAVFENLVEPPSASRVLTGMLVGQEAFPANYRSIPERRLLDAASTDEAKAATLQLLRQNTLSQARQRLLSTANEPGMFAPRTGLNDIQNRTLLKWLEQVEPGSGQALYNRAVGRRRLMETNLAVGLEGLPQYGEERR